MKINVKNELIKRKFFRRLREAEGLAEATVNCIEKAIALYEDFTKNADYAKLNPDKAVAFKKWLQKREFRGTFLSLSTQHGYLRYLVKFFTWLSGEPGYKSKIAIDTIAYLKLSRKDERVATQYTPRNFPAVEYVRKLADSINVINEIDLRDRALIAFAILSGARDKALATLPLGCFNEETLVINQNPRAGVETKFAKHIPTTLFLFDEKLLSYVTAWVQHLRSREFGSQDPLFPRSKAEHGENSLSFLPAQEVTPEYWKTTGRIRQIFKRRAEEANLPYFPPHTFRHSAIESALRSCKNGAEIKAVSQNFGHEHVATTFSSYGNYDPVTLSGIIKHIDFGKKGINTNINTNINNNKDTY
ncbi:MAG TPA: recombinase XerC [Candidatus Omnitrophica bacterium]|nr:MAG: hypothetical protein A2Z81_04505 [Omnitrophica WOR_2 bacterium GWA2_45_18]HBR13958.1 recombinase XerC [Candidatus Omnitrophota bacterium]